MQLNELHEWHSQDYKNENIYKEKMKAWHDKCIEARVAGQAKVITFQFTSTFVFE